MHMGEVGTGPLQDLTHFPCGIWHEQGLSQRQSEGRPNFTVHSDGLEP